MRSGNISGTWRKFAETETIACDDRAGLDGDWFAKDRAFENEGMIFSVLAARICSGGEARQELVRDRLSRERGIENARVDTDRERFKTSVDKIPCEGARLFSPQREETGHSESGPLRLAIIAQVLQEKITGGDAANPLFAKRAHRSRHSRFVFEIRRRRGNFDDVERQLHARRLPLDERARHGVHADRAVRFEARGEQADDFDVTPFPQGGERETTVLSAAPEQNRFRFHAGNFSFGLMIEPLLFALLGVVVIGFVITIVLGQRGRRAAAETASRLEALERAQEREERTFRDEFARNRDEAGTVAKAQREELAGSLKNVSDSTLKSLGEISAILRGQLEQVSAATGKLTDKVDLRLKELQQDNAQQIDKMRATVDEKLQGTLEKRLGESFKLVSDRLEQVHQGLGAMQQLASDVGGLQKVLTNVKTRGGWGEVQLGSLLEQVLTQDQFARNVQTRDDTGERVEYAIKLPGDGNGAPVWLPIDAKFPTEDYQRLIAAQEQGDIVAIDDSMKSLETQLRRCAKDICGKYINPPKTTDFGIMFLPTEGLYAEAIRRIGLVEQVQRECRVIFAGPTTLAALLNSLQMGFRTLAIQQRSSEVWSLLAGVKNEFGKFGDALSAVKDKLDQASRHVDKVAIRSRAITKKLQDVQALPVPDAAAVVDQLLPELSDGEDDALSS